MNAILTTCPDAQAWQRFLCGQIPDGFAQAYEAHLLNCQACTRLLRELEDSVADDSLVAALRHGSTIWESLRTESDAHVVRASVAADYLDPPTSLDELGWMAGYRVLRLLGQGGNGRVYLAYDERLSRHVALKVILDERRRGPLELARFEREACLLAQLDHPGIVRIFEVGSYRGCPYMALEYLEGGTLAERLKGNPFAFDAAARVVRDLASAVRHAHERGILHRDLKPGNVLLTTPLGHDLQGLMRIADFGLARRFDDDRLTHTGDLLGTPGYTAPELFEGRVNESAATCDIFSLGAILYELLVGRLPFRGESSIETIELSRTQDPLAPRRLRPAIARDLETICLKCLERNPTRRYLSAAGLCEDLTRYLEGRAIQARPVSVWDRLAKWTRRRPAVAGLAGVLLAILVSTAIGIASYEQSLRHALSETVRNERLAIKGRTDAERQARRADDNYEQARKSLQQMLVHTSDPRWNGVPRLQQLRRQQAETALAFFQHVAKQHPEDAQARLDAARATVEAGKLQIFLGRKEEGVVALRGALEEAQTLSRANPNDATAKQVVADASIALGVQAIGAEHLELVERGVAQLIELARTNPTSGELRSSHTDALITMGAVYIDAARYVDAERVLLEAIRLDDAWLAEHPDALPQITRRARARVNLCAAYRQLKRLGDCREQHQLAEDDLEQILRLDLANRGALEGLAVLRINGAYDLQSDGRLKEAVDYIERNVPLLEEALRREPEDAMYHDRLLRTFGVASTMYGASGDKRKAAETWERVVELTPRDELPTRRVLQVVAWLDADDSPRALAAAVSARESMKESTNEELWREWALVLERLIASCQQSKTLDEAERANQVESLRVAAEEARQPRPSKRP